MISVWWIGLDPSSPLDRVLDRVAESVLSTAELARAARFRFDEHRRRWIVAHIALRQVLGHELAVSPAALTFASGSGGKPRLTGDHADALEFNLSHSGAMALIAVSRSCPVGVDVEMIEPMPDLEAVAERQFAPEERQALRALPDADRVGAFYRIWTRKEAFIKATGTGLGHALDRFAVSHERGDARFIHFDGDARAAESWSLVDMEIEGRYVGAVAAPLMSATVHLERWPTE